MALTTNLQKVEALYVAYYGRAGDPAGVTYWVNQLNGGKSFADLAGYFATQTESKVAYPYLVNPTLVDPTSFVTQIYQNLFARAPDAGGLTYWVAQLTANQGNAAFIAQFINYVVGGAAPADAAVLDNKVVAASYFTQVMATTGNSLTDPATGQLTPAGSAEAKAATATVNGDAASVQASKDATDAIKPPGANFNLTTGTDNIVGSGGSDIITAGALAADGVTPATTLNVLDTINGGGGVDTLVVDTTGDKNLTIQGTITNVENLTIVGNGATIANVVATPFSGTIAFKGTSDASISVSAVTGQTVVLDTVANNTIVDVAYAATQATATLAAKNGPAVSSFYVKGDALKTVDLTITSSVSGNSVQVQDTGTVDTVENVNITSNVSGSVIVASDALKAVKVIGSGAVTLTATAAASIDASGNTGGVTAVNELAAAASFTGGAGKDSVKLGASTKANTLGAGDDTVTWSGAALGVGGTVDGGEGVDTIVLTALNAAAATLDATVGKAFADSIQNFEKFGIAATAATTVVNAKYLDGITHIISAGGTDLLTINNLAANSTVELTANNASGTVLSLADASGTADVLNLKLVGAAGFDTGAISAAGVETLNITTLDNDGAATAFTASISATAAKSVVISGNAGIDVTASLAGTAVTSFDASGVTGTGAAGAVKYTSGALTDAATIKGGAGDDVLNLAAATKSVTVDGGAGNDTITTGVGADTIVGGAGNDIISSGKGLDILTGGAGNDTFHLVANSNGNIYATITDATAGDKLDFTGKGADTFNGAKVTLAETAVFQDYLNEAAKGLVPTNGVISWFQFGGNTYVVEDISVDTSFKNGTDTVVKLTGLIDLSTATNVGDVLTLG